jgi:hypothetical protein
MNLKTHSSFWCCLFLLSVTLADSSLAGSVYSRHGIGLLYYRDGVRAAGMGGIGLAIPDSVSITFLIPLHGVLTLTRFQGDFLYERSSIDLNRASGLFHDANVNSFSLAVPIKRGYVVAFGVQPYSRSEYEFYKSGNDSTKLYVENLKAAAGERALSGVCCHLWSDTRRPDNGFLFWQHQSRLASQFYLGRAAQHRR